MLNIWVHLAKGIQNNGFKRQDVEVETEIWLCEKFYLLEPHWTHTGQVKISNWQGQAINNHFGHHNLC